MRIVRRRKTHQGKFLVTGRPDRFFSRIYNFFYTSLPNRARDHPGMAEPAAAGTSTHDLDRKAVMNHLDIWNDETCWRRGELPNDPFHDRCSYFISACRDPGNRSIFKVVMFEKRRHIHARTLR